MKSFMSDSNTYVYIFQGLTEILWRENYVQNVIGSLRGLIDFEALIKNSMQFLYGSWIELIELFTIIALNSYVIQRFLNVILALIQIYIRTKSAKDH